MAKRPRDSVEREIMDIIPERFDGGDSDPLGERRGGPVRLIVTISVGLLALAIVGVAARHILVGDGPRSVADANVPVIKPDDKPIKTKPEDRGGMAVPNQDKLVYQDLNKGDAKSDSGASEKLLPPPEKPQAPAMKATPDDSASSAMPPPPAAGGSDIPAPPPVAATTQAANTPAAPTAAPNPKVTATPVSPTPNSQATALTPVKETGKKPADTAKKEAAPKPTVTAAATPAPEPKAAAPAGSGGNFQIQLAALKSEADAQAAWKKAQAANKDLLGALSPDIVRADLGAKGVFFRLRAGALDEAGAKALCAQLVAHNQGCIVARK